MFTRILLAVVLISACPRAQNLLNPNAWQAATIYTANLVTGSPLTFTPYCTGQCSGAQAGVTQTVTIPTAGTYQLAVRGNSTARGTLPCEAWIGNQRIWSIRSEWTMNYTVPVSLAAGPTTVRFLSGTDTITGPLWTLYIELEPARAPVTTVQVTSAGRSFASARLSSPALLLAIGLRSATPITVPGLTGTLDIAPGTLLVLAASAQPGISVDFSQLAAYYPYPFSFVIQSVDAAGFGLRTIL